MSQPLTPKSIRNLGLYGVIRRVEVEDHLTPDGSVVEAMNVSFDRKGAVSVRPGLARLGTSIQAGYLIFGLHNVQNGSAIAAISQASSMRVYTFNGGSTWSSNLTSGTASAKVRFVNFADAVTAINWGVATNGYSSMQVWSGDTDAATWTTSGNPINPQNIWSNSVFPQFGEVYKSRMYLSGDSTNPDRLFFSSVITSAGNITWAPAADFVDINPNDGENITGIKRYSLELLIFKPNYIYRFRTSALDPDPLIKIGTRSHESIVEGKRGLYFHHDTGFYRYTGGYPEEISRAISDFVDAIPYSHLDDVISWNDPDHIYWSLGDLTISETTGDVTWSNVVVRYTESSDVWTVYSYPVEIRRGIAYNSGSGLSRIVGTDNGVVATHNSGTIDLNEPIKYRLVTRWYEGEGIAFKKVINQLIALCEKAQDMRLMYQVDEEKEPWRDLGQLTKFINVFDLLNIKFRRVRFKVTGVTSLEAPIFLGIEITKGVNEGITL